MQAAILGAGLGTRLRPLTYRTPKALVPVLNRPLLGVVLAQLREAGATRLAVNTHHLADQVQHFIEANCPSGLEVVIRPEPEILGTGGGLGSLGGALGDGPFLAVNADILTDLDMAAIFQAHQEEALATLVLHDYPPYNTVWIDEELKVTGIGRRPDEKAAAALAYTGVQVVNPRLLQWLPQQEYADLVAVWRQAIAQGERLSAVVVSGCFWQDLGTPEAYLAAHARLLSGASPGLARFFATLADPLVGEEAVLGEEITCAGGVCLGRGVHVGQGAWLKNTVVWDRAWIAPQVRLENCIVGHGARVSASARDRVLV